MKRLSNLLPLLIMAISVSAQEYKFQLLRNIYSESKSSPPSSNLHYDDYARSILLTDGSSTSYHNGHNAHLDGYINFAGVGLRTKEYPLLRHYWSLVSVVRDTHCKNFKERMRTDRVGYLVLDSIEGVCREAWSNSISMQLCTIPDNLLTYAKGVTAKLTLLCEPAELWGHLLSPKCLDISVSRGTVHNIAEVYNDNLRDTTGELWNMCRPVMDEMWISHIDRALGILGEMVAEQTKGDATIPASFDAILFMAELADGSLQAELADDTLPQKATIDTLNVVLSSLPKRLLPILYTVDGLPFPGYVVKLQKHDNSWTFKLFR